MKKKVFVYMHSVGELSLNILYRDSQLQYAQTRA